MHPEEIKAKIRMKGTTPAVLADELEVSQTLVSKVIKGTSRSARVEQAISKVIGLPVDSIWSDRPKSLIRSAKRAAA